MPARAPARPFARAHRRSTLGVEALVDRSVPSGNPVAADDFYAVPAGTPLAVLPAGVLANDSDPDGLALTAALTLGPTNGTVVLNPDGSFVYAPNLTFIGTDVVHYKAISGNGNSNDAHIYITVGVSNAPPTAAPDTYTTLEDTQLTVLPRGVLVNDTDPNGDPLTATLVVGPARGTVVLNPDGAFTYTPAANFYGTESFTYAVSDGRGGTDTGTVTIDVIPVNDPPSFQLIGNPPTVNEDAGPQTIGNFAFNMSAGPSPGPGGGVAPPQTVTFVVTGNTNPGLFAAAPAISRTGTLTYSSAPNAFGTATITVVLMDNGGTANGGIDTSAPQTFAITVRPVNDPPVGNPDAYSTTVLASLVPFVVSATNGVLVNDTDPDGDALTAVLVNGPSNGFLTLNPDGSFTYRPDLLFVGTDTFAYRARDTAGALSAVTTVTINVGLGNSPPVAVNDSFSTAEDTPLNGSSVLANDTDADGDPLTAQLLTGPARGSLTLRADGTFLYTPAANYNGPDSFTYRVFDGQAYSAAATASLTITAVNDAPIAANDGASVAEDGSVSIPVLANDTDPEGDPLVVVSVTPGGRGTTTTDGTTVTFTPAPDFFGTDTFQYTVSDGNGGMAIATVTVTVTPVEDPATLDPIADRTVAEDAGPRAVPLTGISAGGGESQPLTVTATSSNPALIPDPVVTYTSPNAGGTLRFTSAPDANGTATIAVTVSDGVTTVIRTFVITVTPVDDAPRAVRDTYATVQNTEMKVTGPGVLSNDTDIENDRLTARLVAGPAHGKLTLYANGSFTYIPNRAFHGTDSFTYRAYDGQLTSRPVTVTIRVRREDPKPVDPVVPPVVQPGPVGGTGGGGSGGDGSTQVTSATVLVVPPVIDGGPIPFGAGPSTYLASVPINGPAFSAPVPVPTVFPPALPPVTSVPLLLPPIQVDIPPAPVAVALPAVPVPDVMAIVPPVAALLADNPVFTGLNELTREVAKVGRVQTVTGTVVGTGMVATAGYVLLSPRLAFWFLSALLARRTVWKPFDPLEVVYAWDRDQEKAGGPDGDDEALEKMVS